MRSKSASLRTKRWQLGVPAAVLGALAGTMVAAPASAEASPASTPIERLHGATRAVPAVAAPASYIVQAGDTIFAIAERFGLRTADVLAWNDLSSQSVIFPGQTLTLVTQSTAAPTVPQAASASHTVTAGDTVFGIAQKYGTSVDAVLAANALTRESVIYPGQALSITGSPPAASPPPISAPPAAQTHTVAAGDTLFAIAQKYGTSTHALYTANGLGPDSIIYPGQTIAVSTPPVAATPPAPTALSATLDAEQAANAGLIIAIGRQLGVSERGIAIALATSMVESWMRNLDWGDRDSLGLFQQRPSTGWGSPEQIRDADRSIRVFYGGPSDPNGVGSRGLLDIPGWENMDFSAAAQAVQISAFPDRYGQWELQAYQWLAQYG